MRFTLSGLGHLSKLLKYLPAAFCGLFLCVWIASLLVNVEIDCLQGGTRTLIVIEDGSVIYRGRLSTPTTVQPHPLQVNVRTYAPANRFYIGRFHLSRTAFWQTVILPAPVLLPVLLPIAIGCLVQFRFPLWSWFAWTGLIAAELAYYLR